MYEHFHDDFDKSPNYSVGLWLRQNHYTDYSYKGTIIEVGGGDPELLSVSKHFIKNGWDALIIEPNPYYVEKHKESGNQVFQFAISDKESESEDFFIYEDDNKISLGWSSLGLRLPGCQLKSKTITVPVITLNTFFKSQGLTHVDVISIDVEGWEYEVVSGFDETKYSANYIITEMNGYYTEYQRLSRLLESKGYELVYSEYINWIYKKKK